MGEERKKEEKKKIEGLKPYRKTPNGYFIKEGEDFLYYGFPEPWFDKNSKYLKPGFEIFFTHEFTKYEDPYFPKAQKDVGQNL